MKRSASFQSTQITLLTWKTLIISACLLFSTIYFDFPESKSLGFLNYLN